MYFSWNQQTIPDLSAKTVEHAYTNGYVLTRIGKGVMDQTRSVRINLDQFALSSENRRILKKTDGVSLETVPLPYAAYHWSIGKMGKDFYETKFGDGTFSANKIKELLTDADKSNFNALLIYTNNAEAIGFCIAHETESILHYCYPFYDLAKAPKDMGLGMMTRAIIYAKQSGKKYVYLGSLQRPGDTYKLQFTGIEWFDGKNWRTDTDDIKKTLAATP